MKNIGVVIPACNEEDYIERCLTALQNAERHFQKQWFDLKDPPPCIHICVVLDSCQDHTAYKIQKFNVDGIECFFRCVGQSRDLGIQHLIEIGCDWICSTDADSCVDLNWFNTLYQLQHADVICGVVELDSWHGLALSAQQQYRAHYQDKMHHRHVHGANLCFKASVYQALGGFKALHCHEDVEFVKNAEQANLHLIWTNQLRVCTSSRMMSRVEHGFADFLRHLS